MKGFGKMYFKKTPNSQHKPFDIYTFLTPINIVLKNELKKFISNQNFTQERLAFNYRCLNFDDYIAVSVFYLEKKIVGFSTVWSRDFYPGDTVRVFNRWFENKQVRKTSKIIGDHHLIAVANHQIQIAKDNDYEWAFISRERGPRFLKKLSDKLSDKTKYSWQVHPKKIPVCYPNAESCWQWVSYANIKNNNHLKWGMLNE